MNIINRKVYMKKDTDDFWNKHLIWSFDFYITKKWNYYEYLNLRNINIPTSYLCYICQRELNYDIFYLTDYFKQVPIGKCCIKRYNQSCSIKYNRQDKSIKKRIKIKEE
jgi:hypothetical protein